MINKFLLITILSLFFSCQPKERTSGFIGRFDSGKDLFLAHFDCKTDVDDLHSVAGVATILADPRFSEVQIHAVAGAYGKQGGLYVPANELFDMAFGNRWSDAHTDFEKALEEETALVKTTLKNGGSIWVAEAGQSDFSAALIREIQNSLPEIITAERVHIVQHSDWNESVTAEENLEFAMANSTYHKIPDGNVEDNGSPGFRTEEKVSWREYIDNPKLIQVWEKAISTANKFNGLEGRYLNSAIAAGGLDFSDVSETCWIFGFEKLKNAKRFFREFGNNKF